MHLRRRKTPLRPGKMRGTQSSVRDKPKRRGNGHAGRRLDGAAATDPDLAKRIDESLGYITGTQAFVDLVGRFGLKSRIAELVDLASAAGTAETVAAAAVGTAFVLGGDDAVKPRVAAVL